MTDQELNRRLAELPLEQRALLFRQLQARKKPEQRLTVERTAQLLISLAELSDEEVESMLEGQTTLAHENQPR